MKAQLSVPMGSFVVKSDPRKNPSTEGSAILRLIGDITEYVLKEPFEAVLKKLENPFYTGGKSNENFS